MVAKDCISKAIENLKSFTKDELDGYAKEVFSRAQNYQNLSSRAAIQKSMDEVNSDRLKDFYETTSQKARNVMNFERDAKRLQDKLVNMRSILATRYHEKGDSIAASQKAAEGKLSMFLYNSLTREEMEYFSSGNHQNLIEDAFDGRSVEDPTAKKIGKLIHDYFDYRNAEEVNSGALKFSQIRNDRLTRAVHDASKLLNGGKSLASMAKDIIGRKYDVSGNKNLWINFIKQHIDVYKTFRYTNAFKILGENVEDPLKSIDMEEADKILGDVYDNITTGKSNIFSQSSVVNDPNVVKQRRHMFFVWKDLRSQMAYNRVYGKGDLFTALRADIQSSANKIGVAQRWGDNPRAMYLELKKVQQEISPQKPRWWDHTDYYYKAVMREDRLAKDPQRAVFWANLRTVSSMARLITIVPKSLSDLGYIASFSHRMGNSYFKSWFYLLRNIFNNYPSEERKSLASLYKIMVDSHLGYMGRWADSNNMSSLMNKISTAYFKFNGLAAFDKGNKISIMHLMSKGLYNNSGKSFEELHPSMKKWVAKFMDSNEWDLLRRKNKDSLFTTDNVDALSDDELRAHQNKNNLTTPLYQIRNDLFRKVYSMFDVSAENAVLSPSDFERAWCFMGEPPGTVKGELLRTIAQFKMYTIAYIDRVLVQGLKDADSAQQKILWAASMLMGTLPLSVLSMFLDNYSNGLSMPDWDELSIGQREKYLVNLLAPGFGIFSGLLEPYNQNSDMALSLLGGPLTRLIGNGMSSAFALASGNPKKAAKNLTNAAGYLFPVQQVPVLSPILRQAMGAEAHLQPGQTHLYGQ